MLVRERAAGCVSAEICQSKNDNKDTNGSKGVNLCRDLGYSIVGSSFCHFLAVVVRTDGLGAS